MVAQVNPVGQTDSQSTTTPKIKVALLGPPLLFFSAIHWLFVLECSLQESSFLNSIFGTTLDTSGSE